MRNQAERDAEACLKAKVTERDVQIAGMQRKIEELRRRATQDSEQLQGEAFEHEVEAALRQQFPWNQIERVPPGESDGDILQRVCNDQRAVQADVAPLASHVLPKDCETFGGIDGIWVRH